MAELADALDSGSNRGNSVEVQVLLSAPRKTSTHCVLVFLFRCERGLEQGGGAQRRKQSHSAALLSPRFPTCRNVYREAARPLSFYICNDPLGYADLILNGDPEEYLKNVAGSHGLED